MRIASALCRALPRSAALRRAAALDRMKKLTAAAAALALAAAFYAAWRSGLSARLSDYEQIVEWMRSSGVRGPLFCVAIQFAQVVIFAIPGEITQIAAGYVFGPYLGFLYSAVGITLGSAFDYGFARLAGRPVVARILGRARLTRIDGRLRSSKGRIALFLLFLAPGMPKDAMSYGAGLTDFRFLEFVAISAVARSPALFLSTLFGAQAYSRNYFAMALIGAAAVLLVAGFLVYRKKWGQGA